jgi:hypothetical protein
LFNTANIDQIAADAEDHRIALSRAPARRS